MRVTRAAARPRCARRDGGKALPAARRCHRRRATRVHDFADMMAATGSACNDVRVAAQNRESKSRRRRAQVEQVAERAEASARNVAERVRATLAHAERRHGTRSDAHAPSDRRARARRGRWGSTSAWTVEPAPSRKPSRAPPSLERRRSCRCARREISAQQAATMSTRGRCFTQPSADDRGTKRTRPSLRFANETRSSL